MCSKNKLRVLIIAVNGYQINYNTLIGSRPILVSVYEFQHNLAL